jgi:nucleoside-diphosphate-sugar epimerase
VYGDLSDPNQVREAMKGIEIVYHVGAAMDGGWDVHRASTVQGTQNILDAAKETKPKRIV